MLSLFLSMIEDDESKTKFENIYNDYHDSLLSITVSITKDLYDAEDALQNTFYIIAKNIDRIRTDNKSELKSFLYKIAKNASIDILRGKEKEKHLSLDLMTEQESPDNVVLSVENNETYKILVNKIYELPMVYKDILVLSLIRGYSLSKISELLSINRNTAKSRLAKAKSLLKKLVGEVREGD